MVEHEYNLLTLYSDYEIEMEIVNGQSCVSSLGRVTIPTESQVITYKVTLINKTTNDVEEVILSSSINGVYCK